MTNDPPSARDAPALPRRPGKQRLGTYIPNYQGIKDDPIPPSPPFPHASLSLGQIPIIRSDSLLRASADGSQPVPPPPAPPRAHSSNSENASTIGSTLPPHVLAMAVSLRAHAHAASTPPPGPPPPAHGLPYGGRYGASMPVLRSDSYHNGPQHLRMAPPPPPPPPPPPLPYGNAYLGPQMAHPHPHPHPGGPMPVLADDAANSLAAASLRNRAAELLVRILFFLTPLRPEQFENLLKFCIFFEGLPPHMHCAR